MDEMYKCGYCGYLIDLYCSNYLEHVCFAMFQEEKHELVSDGNNILTVVDKETKNVVPCLNTGVEEEENMSWEELLIRHVENRKSLYDSRLPLQERTMAKKNLLWDEIHNLLGGKKTVEEIKAKWKYLRDCYLKAKKKYKQYKPSGSASQNTPDPGFRYFQLMKFLDDTNDGQLTITSLSQASPSTTVSPQNSPQPLPTPSKKRKAEDLQKGILEALATSTQNDGIDGILLRIGDSLRKFPYRERAKLEIDILKMIYDKECELNLC